MSARNLPVKTLHRPAAAASLAAGGGRDSDDSSRTAGSGTGTGAVGSGGTGGPLKMHDAIARRAGASIPLVALGMDMIRTASTAVAALLLVAASATHAAAPSDEPLFAGWGSGGQGRGTPLPAGVRKLADVPYGSASRQRIDVYLPPAGAAPAGGAPLLVMVHGGAWMFGDKSSPGVVGEKLAHWVAHGWILVSVNNRLWPQADPLAQARDVAAAIALVQEQSAAWGGNAKQLVLMGHSAGAHLVALLAASPTLAAQSGAAPWAGTVVLDSAAIDLTTLMQHRHARFYDRVFGTDPAGWHDASPTDRLEVAAAPLFLVCSTLRGDDSCGQTQQFAKRATALGRRAIVQKEALSHLEVNADLGRPGAYTDAVDAFIASVLNSSAH